MKSDPNNQLITLTMITLSGVHCIRNIHSKDTKDQHFKWNNNTSKEKTIVASGIGKEMKRKRERKEIMCRNSWLN
jgi:hypothetical protein